MLLKDITTSPLSPADQAPRQISLKEPVRITGVNIFNGRSNYAVFHPANDGSGIVFTCRRKRIPASLATAYNHRLLGGSCMGVRTEDERVVKVEHILSALYGLGIDNALIELQDNVCPRVDNGVAAFVEALGPQRRQGALKKICLTVKPSLDHASCSIAAAGRPDRLEVRKAGGALLRYEAEYPHRAVGRQELCVDLSEESYRKHIMHAKPIFFLPCGSRFLVDRLGRFHGIRDDNALLIGRRRDERFMNRPVADTDRHAFVRHKIMDALGALSLTGCTFVGVEFLFSRTGHAFDIAALRELFNRDIFEPC